MIPPRGFEAEKYPLRHRLINATGLSIGSEDANTVLFPIVMFSNEMDVAASTIQVNPHNASYEEDGGPLCRNMSIIDKMRISLKFTRLATCGPAHHSSGTSTNELFIGDDIPSIKFLWRPIWNSFGEKLDAADDNTTTTVAAILGLTKDATFEDVVPLTTNKLVVTGPSETNLAVSTVNAVQVFGDFNMTTNIAQEDHVFDETLLQNALRRYTNKGALRSCIGRTRHVTLTANKPYMNFYIDKFVPRAIRRVMEYGFFGIQVHLPEDDEIDQHYLHSTASGTVSHLGIKCIATYHEWNPDHDQGEGSS